MANVLMCVPVNSVNNHVSDRVVQLIQKDSHQIHNFVTDPEAADVILFVSLITPYFDEVLKNPLYKKYKPKCFVISDRDKFIPMLPGLYASMDRNFYDSEKYSGWAYLGIYDKEYIGFRDNYNKAEFFFSFIGSDVSHSVRKKIFKLSHSRARIINTTMKRNDLRNNKLFIEDYRKNYVELLSKSKFILCPRGFGTSSFRLYETMIVGRVPVIISDDLVLPEGPDWESFSIRVKERDVDKIPEILEKYEPDFKEMGIKARSEWDKWFSTSSFLHNAIEKCLQIKSNPNYEVDRRIYFQFFKPYHFARNLKLLAQKALRPKKARFDILNIEKN